MYFKLEMKKKMLWIAYLFIFH